MPDILGYRVTMGWSLRNTAKTCVTPVRKYPDPIFAPPCAKMMSFNALKWLNGTPTGFEERVAVSSTNVCIYVTNVLAVCGPFDPYDPGARTLCHGTTRVTFPMGLAAAAVQKPTVTSWRPRCLP